MSTKFKRNVHKKSYKLFITMRHVSFILIFFYREAYRNSKVQVQRKENLILFITVCYFIYFITEKRTEESKVQMQRQGKLPDQQENENALCSLQVSEVYQGGNDQIWFVCIYLILLTYLYIVFVYKFSYQRFLILINLPIGVKSHFLGGNFF